MAYDANAAYVPPRRAYYAQAQQQAPVQVDNRSQAQTAYDDFASPPFDQGYDQRYDQYNGYSQDPRVVPQVRAPLDDNGHGGVHQDQRQERQYDARYQQRQAVAQRQQRSQSPNRTEHQGGLPSRPNPSSGRMYQQPAPRPDLRQAQSYTSQRSAQQHYNHEQPNANLEAIARAEAIERAEAAAKLKAHSRPDPAKMSMDEWKAKERARMHAEMQKPETLAQDNAFPVFPTPRNNGGRSAVSSAAGFRPGEEAGRLSSDGRPGMSRENSSNTMNTTNGQQHLMRPSMDHKPFSFEPIKDRPSNVQESPPPERPAYSRQASSNTTSPVLETNTQQWPTQGQRQSPPHRRPVPQASNSLLDPRHDNADSRHAQQDPRQAHRPPPMQAIDVRKAQQLPRPGYMDHQPLSPAAVPPRPSTAQGARSNLHQQVGRPSFDDQNAYASSGQARQLAQPSVNQHQQRQHGEFNSGFDEHRMPPPVTAPARSRDEEIEAEMPDFDSAAPGGTSLLYKRNQTPKPQANSAVSPPMSSLPPQHMNHSVQSLPMQKQRFYDQQDVVSQFDQRGAQQNHNGIDGGFVFGVPGESPQPPYEDPYQQRPPQSQSVPYQQRPIQPPFANEQPPRRSMDDARQMPYRPGPQQMQRPHQNGRPVKGGFGPQHRPGMERNLSAQTAYSDPGQQRVGSAPPARQALQEPPRTGFGSPLAQQRSAPERPELQRDSNPDALPHHPVPVRPGLMEGGPPPPNKPSPVRNYGTAGASSHQRQVSVDRPVTNGEIEQLRAAVAANPNDSRQALRLAKRLVEAASVLASEGGRADQRTTARNREKYILEAHKRVKKLVAVGYPEAQFYLADCYGQGLLGLEVDTKEAFNLYQAAAKAGHPEAAYRTAVCCEMGPDEGGGIRKDYAKAVQWYRRGAALGDAAAMYKLGMILLKGLLGQQRNVGEALIWLKRAAERGENDNPHALHELASLYESSNTNPEVRNKVVADDRYALELYQKAASLGHKFAQFRLGQAYEYGSMRLPIDNRASITWYTKAAAQGEHQAELALSGWYLTGAEGILEHSDTEAYLWARKAASSEPPLAKAMFAMGYFSETGIGCPASLEEARRWYGRAASYRFPKAQERLEELRKGGKGSKPANGKLSRKDQKRDEAECTVM